MRRKPKHMFTTKSHPRRGIMSAILGGISVISIIFAIYLSYQARGAANARFGAAALLALLFSLAGMVLGILSHLEKERYLIFPRVGICLNFGVIAFIGFILYIGA